MKRPAISLSYVLPWSAGRHRAREERGGGKAAAPRRATRMLAASGGARRRADKAATRRAARKPRPPARASTRPSTSPPRSRKRSAARKAQRPTTTLSWQDIVVVPRKAFLKGGRARVRAVRGHHGQRQPDPPLRVRRRPQLLPDRRALGRPPGAVLRQAARPTQAELVGLQYNRTPTLNRTSTAARSTSGYVPVYGKFALFNRSIMHWEIWASAGVGATVTEIIPRDPAEQTRGLPEHRAHAERRHRQPVLPVRLADRELRAARLHLRRQVRADPIATRPGLTDTGDARRTRDSALVNNVMFYAGVGIYLPTKFTYKTPR